MSIIFLKTAKGTEEIKTRAAGLSQKIRQVLIFVDGKRSDDALKEMLKADDIREILDNLAMDGFIEVGSVLSPRVEEPAPAVAPPPVQPKAAEVVSSDVQPSTANASGLDEEQIKAQEQQKKREQEMARKKEQDMAFGFMSKM